MKTRRITVDRFAMVPGSTLPPIIIWDDSGNVIGKCHGLVVNGPGKFVFDPNGRAATGNKKLWYETTAPLELIGAVAVEAVQRYSGVGEGPFFDVGPGTSVSDEVEQIIRKLEHDTGIPRPYAVVQCSDMWSCLPVQVRGPAGGVYNTRKAEPSPDGRHIMAFGPRITEPSVIHEWAHVWAHRFEGVFSAKDDPHPTGHGRKFFAALKEVTTRYYGDAKRYPWRHDGEYPHIGDWAREEGLTS